MMIVLKYYKYIRRDLSLYLVCMYGPEPCVPPEGHVWPQEGFGGLRRAARRGVGPREPGGLYEALRGR